MVYNKEQSCNRKEEAMPVVNHSSYNSPIWLRNGHLQTIWPVLFRNPPLPSLWRERLETPDGDFIDIDHIPACAGIRSGRVAILSHGLEGNSTRRYMLGMAEALNRRGWDVVARNFRGCSGEMNHTLPLYHGGETDDLHLVVQYCVSLGYGSIVLVGFSMGGNQTLKYLGERDRAIPSQVSAAVAVSVPCDMEGAAEVLSLPSRAPYMAYFLSKKNIPASPIASISTGSTASVRSANSTIAIPPRCTASIPHAIIGGKAAACGFWSILMCPFC